VILFAVPLSLKFQGYRHYRSVRIIVNNNYLCLVLQYPYIPAHITKPKEHKRLYLVQLPEKGECFLVCCEYAKVVELVIQSKNVCSFSCFLV